MQGSGNQRPKLQPTNTHSGTLPPGRGVEDQEGQAQGSSALGCGPPLGNRDEMDQGCLLPRGEGSSSLWQAAQDPEEVDGGAKERDGGPRLPPRALAPA